MPRNIKTTFEFEYRSKHTGAAWRRVAFTDVGEPEPRSEAAAQWRLWRMLPKWTRGTNLRVVAITETYGKVVRKRRRQK